MSDKHAQAIGGIKSQQRILRRRIERLERDVAFLYWSLSTFFALIAAALLARYYGWW